MQAPPLSKISSSTILYCYDELVKACERGDLEEVRKRIPWTLPTLNQSYPLSMAAAFGHVECVKELLPVSNVERYGGRAMAYASSKGQTSCVEILVPFAHEDNFEQCFSIAAGRNYGAVIDILAQSNTNPVYIAGAMQSAVREGHANALSALVAHLCDTHLVQDKLHNALTTAIRHNHTECVNIVLTVADAQFNNSGALQECFNSEPVNMDIFNALFPVSDAKAALTAYTVRCAWKKDKIQWLEQRIEHATLTSIVGECTPKARAERKI